MAFPADVELVLASAVPIGLVELHHCHCASSVSSDSVLHYFGKEGAYQLDFMYYSQVSFYRSFQISMGRTLNPQLHLLSDFGGRLFHQVLRFHYCSA